MNLYLPLLLLAGLPSAAAVISTLILTRPDKTESEVPATAQDGSALCCTEQPSNYQLAT